MVLTRLARAALPLASMLLLAAASPALRPGLWEVRNLPGRATLDGHAMADLPLSPITAERVCLTPAQATDAAAWLARDLVENCSLTTRNVTGGRVDIVGACAAQDGRSAPGRVSLDGRYSANRYDLRFTTVSHAENGAMGFDGRMAGRRVGDCPR